MNGRAIAGTLLTALAIGGCGGAQSSMTPVAQSSTTPGAQSSTTPGGRSSTTRGGRARPQPAQFPGIGSAHVTSSPAAVPARLAEACSTAVSSQRALTGGSNRFVSTAPEPFGIAISSDGRFAFVSTGRPAIQVVGGIPTAPRLIRTVALPPQTTPLGLALTPDGHYLLAASGGGALVLNTARLERGGANAYLGELEVPVGNHPGFQRTGGAIEVTVTPNSKYVFVSLEDTRRLAVYNLQAALASGFRGSYLVGYVPTGLAPVGMAVSPDGRWLYATSEVGGPRATRTAYTRDGSVTAISVAEAITQPARSVVATVPAGCSPVRIVTTQGGRIILVAARESDELLAFSATRLQQRATNSLLAAVRVGESPVGVSTGDGGHEAIVNDSNRFEIRGATSGLTIVDVSDLLAGRPSIIGELKAGLFPRDAAVTPNGQTALVTDFDSAQIQVVKLSH